MRPLCTSYRHHRYPCQLLLEALREHNPAHRVRLHPSPEAGSCVRSRT